MRAVTATERWLYRNLPLTQRLLRGAIYAGRETFVLGFTGHPRLMNVAEGMARRHLRGQVADPELRRRLTPTYRIGCKRILLSSDYYPAITRANVELVSDRIAEVRPHSILSADGAEREVDTIIFGTGFHVTDQPIAQRLCGRENRSLADVWSGSPQAYRGTTVTGFPNMFMLAGPNTGLGHTSLVFMIESQIGYVLDALRTLGRRGATVFDVRAEDQARYNRDVQARMQNTVWVTGGCSSWYLDARGRNSALWPTFTWPFHQRTARFDADAYELSRAVAA
jgi:cation diffusion facilitator CzcD-associated flavoprotein CzcO